MKTGVIAFVVLVLVVIVIAYIYTGFNFYPRSTTTTAQITSHSTTISPTVSTTTTTIPSQLPSCSAFQISSQLPYANASGSCKWSGGTLGVWTAAGNPGPGTVVIKGQNGIVYANTGFPYNCTTFLENVTLPAQNYTVYLNTGPETGSCGTSLVKLNLTTAPPPSAIYDFVYNGNFSNGEYTGWSVSGAGFGKTPLNITQAVGFNTLCYLGTPWQNYTGDYVATTYNCGLSTAPGNLTSQPFRVNGRDPFLNFKIISPDDNFIYIEILELNLSASSQNPVSATPKIIAHYNTYNLSVTANAASTFMNASIPLTTLTNKAVAIRIVADTLERGKYIAVGDFTLGPLPLQQPGINANVTILNG
jgi:hypothetical protein